MTPPRKKPRVFFDASVIFSAVYSSTGASSKLASWSSRGKIIGFTSQTVIEEVIANADKFKSKIQPTDINQFILKHNFMVRDTITLNETKSYTTIVHPKDAHVLAGANLTQSDYLVTLDKKHLNRSPIKSKVAKIYQIKILSPHQFVALLSQSIKSHIFFSVPATSPAAPSSLPDYAAPAPIRPPRPGHATGF